MIEREADLQGARLKRGEEFNFSCRPGLSCFNTCCRDKRLPLYPYDVLRLRRALGLASQEVLARFAELEFDPVSGWPALRLRLDEQGRCPFVREKGCSVYPHRPAACRIYPLARAVAPQKDKGKPKELYLCQESPKCLGWRESQKQDLDSWEASQGLSDYHQANDRLMRLLLHPARTGRLKLNQAQTHAVIGALYNLDVFRQSAAQPGFGERFGFSPGEMEKAQESDEALLALGESWLAKVLFE